MAIHIQIEGLLLLIPEKQDPCQLWKSYFISLKKAVGLRHARMIWLLTWKSNGATLCITAPDFNKWMLQSGLDVSNIATRSLADLSEISTNIFGFGKNMSKVMAVGIPVLLLAVLAAVLWMVYRFSKNVQASDLLALHPLSKTTKLIGK